MNFYSNLLLQVGGLLLAGIGVFLLWKAVKWLTSNIGRIIAFGILAFLVFEAVKVLGLLK